jgi:YVTN family beta-propeller protein
MVTLGSGALRVLDLTHFDKEPRMRTILSKLRGGGMAGLGLGTVLSLSAVFGACGDDTETNPSSSTSSAGGGGQGGASSQGGGGEAATTSGTGGAGGQALEACEVRALGPTRGSPVALSPDDEMALVVNRDVGSLRVVNVGYDPLPSPVAGAALDLGAGSEPWQVVFDGCGTRAYVILRHDQKVVGVEGLPNAPVVFAQADLGSEPTGLAITPNNTRLYVSNWVEGTVTVLDPRNLAVLETIDLNGPLAASGLLGTVDARPALAHPRSIAITNDGDDDDTDETIVVTEWFAQRIAPEGTNGADADNAKKGLVYTIDARGDVTLVDLPNVVDTGFRTQQNQVTGCYPNQVSSVSIRGNFAYVTSTCASPEGPIGVDTSGAACTAVTQATDCGLGGVCSGATGNCLPNPTNVKVAHHPALSIVDLGTGTATTTLLDALFDAPAIDSARMPLLPTDIGFIGEFAYVTAEGADAVFRVRVDGASVLSVGSATNDFINLRRDANDAVIKLPIGIATSNDTTKAFGFVAADGSRELVALDFATQSIANGGGNSYRIAATASLPAGGSEAEKVLRGKRFFVTGLGRWSLGGEAWGSCAACHIDGLSDNVTWYFARGPRQSTSLDGSFAKSDPTDQRIFNWTAVFDEVADFELNTRGVSGGVGAVVSATTGGVASRINLAGFDPDQHGLMGSTANVADPGAGLGSVLSDWEEVEAYVKTVRSPRAPVGLPAADVTAGAALFAGTTANCAGCHGGAKWTISRRFYAPSDTLNTQNGNAPAGSLEGTSWNVNLNGFPAALLPVDPSELANGRMRFGTFPATEQLQCVLRPVGTFGVSPAAVGVVELRANMTTPGQGAAAQGRGFNPPSLLGASVGAPFYHAGNARTLEEVFDAIFVGHHQSAVAQTFAPSADQKRQLVAYLLSIDAESPTVAIPPKGATGGSLCFVP